MALAGCASGSSMSTGSSTYMAATAETAAAYNEDYALSGEGWQTQDLTGLAEQKLIVTAELNAQTEDFDGLMEWLSDRLAAFGGYFSTVEVSTRSSGTRYASLTIRVPADELDDFLAGLSQESNVTYESRTTEDVTLQYVDTQSHIEALEAERDRLMELLEGAESLDEVLAVEERLTEVRYQLESYESQRRTLDNQIDYSSVFLNLSDVSAYTEPEPVGFWPRVTAGFKENLEDTGNVLTNAAVWFLSSLPSIVVVLLVLAVILLIVWGCVRIRRKRRGTQDPPERKQKKQERRAAKKAARKAKQAKKTEAPGADPGPDDKSED